MPGVRDNSGSGMGRFGNGFPVLGQVVFVDDITVLAVIDCDGAGANAIVVSSVRRKAHRPILPLIFMMVLLLLSDVVISYIRDM